MRRYTVPMQPQASQPQVLIAGAGPTGLVLALCLARRGVAVRIVDQASGPGLASRAMVVHARTLEFYRQLGFAQQVVDLGIPIHAVHLREDGEEAAELPLGDIGAGLSPYPFVLSFPQDEHERLLVDQLRAAGVEVEWNTALEHFEQDEWGVRATLLQGGQRINTSAAYLCGCDGVHSSTRHALGVAFDGGTYDNLYYVADVHTACANRDLMVHLDANSFALMLPVRTAGMQRLIGIVPQTEHANVIFDDLRPRLEALLGIAIDQVNWFSTYRVHHRVAGRFRVDRVFLAGDAAHVHSPAGGQGMNTGIGDAVNLAWKLAQVLRGGADASLLDTYEPERSAFARKLVATTDRAFELIVAQGAGGRLLRNWLVPRVLPALAGFDAARRALFRTVSQVRIHYHDSGLSGGRAGEIIGGDRLPWVPGQGGEAGPDNFAPMQTLDWQLHMYGAVDPQLAALATALRLPLRAWPWTEAAEQAGLLEDAAYLLRPDMHVALALPRQETDVLQELIARWGLRFGDDAQAATATGWRSQADT
ncbi:pentachlorophenol 4-monooxygenase [Duganella phyllosphaerae]|uniref:Pentachlorophenol 4-monooxygenase n=2 Tax=Duganella phyllosphaerae TaxID=762836 RepID=A0A1E7WW01_9BURK|nr:pentachlorophenol 4-monooxygenase [Duganella phyllosphaerae]